MLEIWFVAMQQSYMVLISCSFSCSDNAGGHGWFSCAKNTSSLVYELVQQ